MQATTTVYFFTGTQCPIARQYAGRMEALGKALAQRGVRCVLVDSNADESAAAFARWAKAQRLSLPLLKDDGTLAQKLGASVTPEAALVDATGEVRYLGRIDDSQSASAVTRQDLLLAVEAVLAGKPVVRPRLPAQGCRISLATPKPAPRLSPTYHRDIKPLLEKHCLPCHRPGNVAPFSLTTYAEAKAWAAPIRRYTQSRQMPPWKAVPGHGTFFDARWLSDRALAMLAAWEATGAPEGKAANSAAPRRRFPPPGSWTLGKPDLQLAPRKPYTLTAEGEDVYRHFLLPVDTRQPRFISAFDFQPGNRRIVHHVILYAITDPRYLGKDGADGQPGWNGSGSPLAGEGISMVAAWAPGSDARRLPRGVGFTLPKGAKLVMEVHYHKTGKPETDQTKVALYSAVAPLKHALETYAVGETDFVLKPDVANQKVTAELEIPEDITLWTVAPHMHQLGKTMRVWATLPGNRTERLILVESWEFKWQGFYHYQRPVYLPKGSTIRLEATYDNTRQNPDQPSLPPREVRYGEQTTDEMCFAFFNFSLGKPPK